MKRVLIDTNVYSAFKSGDDQVVEFLAYAEAVFVCPTVAGELLGGFKAGTRERKNRDEFDRFIDSPRVSILGIDLDTAEYYAQVYRALRAKGKPIPTNDMWIAAVALQHGLALCTLDQHFSHIDGLLVEWPTAQS
jgi:tRNA(fMet)-specific endonuclease VapC